MGIRRGSAARTQGAGVAVHPAGVGERAGEAGRSPRGRRSSALVGALLACYCLASLSAPAAGAATGAPVNLSPPTVGGTPEDEHTVKANKGKWSGEIPIVYSYQWQLCDSSGGECEDIPGATKGSYKATHAEVGDTFRVHVKATNAAGSAGATSAPSQRVAPAPPRRKALPKISGTPEDGQLMTVSNGVWRGTPPFSYAYQWESCNALGTECAPIPGATSAGYRPVSSQIGGKLRAIVTATNTVGSASATSYASKLLSAGPPVSTAAPTISGSLQEGQTLSAGTGAWAGTAPFAFGYQWQRCSSSGGECQDIPGATASTYTLEAADLASRLVVVVSAANAYGSATASSAETSPVAAILPSNTLLPSITGLLQDGQLLSVGTGSWSGSGPIAYSFQWQLCDALGFGCVDIAGAKGASLALTAGDIGGTLDVVVTATNAAGSTSVTTPLSGLIAGILPSNSLLPAVTGLLQDGQLLGIDTGAWSGSEPISFSYQWQLCDALGEACANISEATGSSFALSALDIGKTLDVVVTATNAAGSTSVTTPVTGLIAGLLPSNTALPSIAGTLIDGSLLSAGTGSWSGSEPISYAYQWQLCNSSGGSCNNISEATSSTLKLLTSFIGSTLRVVVTAKNAAGSTSATSSATGLIGALLPSNTALPSIAGTLIDGSLLSAGTGSWSGSEPISYAYQWQQCNSVGASCANISEATGSTLKLVTSLVGSTLRVVVTAKNAAGSVSSTSAATGLIGALLPSNTALPSIAGTLIDGSLLSAATGSWSGSEPIGYAYQWQLCNSSGGSCNNISEATSSTLKLLTSFIGSTLRVVVTAKNAAGSVSSTSAATGLIGALLPSNTALPSIAGTLIDGSLLSAGTGSWSGSEPISYSYQWQQCNSVGASCANISEATGSTLKLVTSLVGSTLRVVVTAKNAAGSTSATSSATGLIGALLPSNTALPTISGILKVGQILTATTGTWTGSAPITYGYQWQLCNLLGEGCGNIAGATSSTFLLGTLDLGLPVRVVVTATNAAGSASKPSEVTGLIKSLL
jgi:large repetitive protein